MCWWWNQVIFDGPYNEPAGKEVSSCKRKINKTQIFICYRYKSHPLSMLPSGSKHMPLWIVTVIICISFLMKNWMNSSKVWGAFSGFRRDSISMLINFAFLENEFLLVPVLFLIAAVSSHHWFCEQGAAFKEWRSPPWPITPEVHAPPELKWTSQHFIARYYFYHGHTSLFYNGVLLYLN